MTVNKKLECGCWHGAKDGRHSQKWHRCETALRLYAQFEKTKSSNDRNAYDEHFSR